jgi:dipeptidyl aminopeptidase/acylaminoacyl peptidase
MTVETIPLELLLGNPEKAAPQISPDGKRMSYVAPVDGVLNVWVGDVGAEAKPVTFDTDRGVQGYAWCHDNKHLFYVQDKGGDENWRIYTVDLESGEIVDRTPFEGVQAQIVAHRKKFPNEILIGLNKDNPQLHDVWHLDLKTGELEKVAENPGFIQWIVDNDLKVRGAAAPTPDGGFAFVHRDDEASEWQPFLVVESDDALGSGPLGFSADGKSMFLVSSVGANASRLVKHELATGDQEVLAEDPTYDVVGASINPDTREPEYAILLKEKAEYVILDPSIAADVEAIKKIHPGAEFGVTDRDHSDRTWLVAFDDDAGPVKYYAYDRDSKNATFLFDHKPQLNDYTLAPMEPFSFKSRDGLEIHGYVTFPAGEQRSNLPTVINVHGGPWARDSWGLNVEAQWLANRGYVCVQINFRGSMGYGKDFVNAGDREWGGKMQDDVSDSVQWSVDQGFADPERICIYGGSYGGYATLVGATFTPELYKCAISIVGPSNLKSFIESIPPYWAPMLNMFKKRVGDPETDEDFLWSRSPLSKVDNISIPLFIAHGANDPRVKLAETEQIVAAMKEKGIDHELMVFEDEGHGFVKPENRLKFYAAAEEFLKEHL